MEVQIGKYTATGSPEWCEFCRFVIEELQDGEIFLFPPEYFEKTYPQHAHRLAALGRT